MPLIIQDSYVLQYFEDQIKYLAVGPPAYMVLESGHNYTTIEGQNLVCASAGCQTDSLLGQIYLASQQPDLYIFGISLF